MANIIQKNRLQLKKSIIFINNVDYKIFISFRSASDRFISCSHLLNALRFGFVASGWEK